MGGRLQSQFSPIVPTGYLPDPNKNSVDALWFIQKKIGIFETSHSDTPGLAYTFDLPFSGILLIVIIVAMVILAEFVVAL